MSIILNPQSSFPIVRQIANHLDSTTYYVRAVVRNADGDIIDTVNLASQGSQRYQSRYRVPVDSSGQGAYISIITSVYTDSGYTTKSPNYGDEENTYLVFDRVLSGRGGGGGAVINQVGGAGKLDSATIRRIVAEEIKKSQPEETEEVEDIEEVDVVGPKLEAISATLSNLQATIDQIPKDNTVDLTEIKQGLEAVNTAIRDKEVTPKTELEPVLEAVDRVAVDVLDQVENLRQFVDGVESKLIESINESVKENLKSVNFTNEFKIEPVTKSKPDTSPQPEPRVYDINKLAS